jgi:hypothetical protein
VLLWFAIGLSNTGQQKLQRIGGKRFHQNYNIQTMKPYASDYSITANLQCRSAGMWSKSYFSVLVFCRPALGQDGELAEAQTGFAGSRAKAESNYKRIQSISAVV